MSIPLDPANASSPGQTAAGPGAQNRLLWAAVGVLGVAVLAMGGVLIRSQTSTPAVPVQVAAPSVAVAAPPVAEPAAPQPVTTPPVDLAPPAAAGTPVAAAKTADPGVAKAAAKPVPPSKLAPTLAQKGQDKAPVANDAPRPVAAAVAGPDAVPSTAPSTAPAPSADTAAQPAGTVTAHPAHTTPVVVAAPPAAVQARPLCINCGTVEAVNAVQQAGTPGGLGALAGGVLGAVVGNQVGQGGGRTLATVLGAVGGGLAGNTVEKGMNKSIQYEVRVRMEDGSVRNLQQATPVAVGDKVLLDNGVLRPAPRTSPDALNHSVVGGQSAPVRLGPSN